MNHFGDEHPPGADARPYLPTEFDPPDRPDENAHGYRPAADAPGYAPGYGYDYVPGSPGWRGGEEWDQ